MCDGTRREGKASSGKKPTGKLRGKAAVKSASSFELSSDYSGYAVLTDKVKVILNQINAQNLKITIQKLKSLSINSETKLKAVVKGIFEKSVNDKQNAEVYAELCKQLSALRVASASSECVYFKNLLVKHCRQEVNICFSDERSGSSQLWFEKMDAIGFWSSGSRTGSPLADAIKVKKMGAVVFVGHLFRAEILTVDYMKAVINKLFAFEDEYVWDCLCSLLLIIGRDMEAKKQDLALCLKKMQEVVDKRQLSASARDKLKLLVEYRRNKWRQVAAVQNEHNHTLKQTAPVLSDCSKQDDAWFLDTLVHVVPPRRVLRNEMRQARDWFNES
jgi:hypothetical protein